jgi:hypothetical protein
LVIAFHGAYLGWSDEPTEPVEVSIDLPPWT